jgi:hypothetical protein
MHKAASKVLFDAEVAKLNQRLLDIRDWQIHSGEYPILDVTFGASHSESSQRIRFTCDEWDDLPPSIQFLSPDGEPLSSLKRDPAGIINTSPHPSTGFPFVCTIGSREYHTHSSHINDHWSNYKGESGFDLGGIVTKLWRAWKKSIQ